LTIDAVTVQKIKNSCLDKVFKIENTFKKLNEIDKEKNLTFEEKMRMPDPGSKTAPVSPSAYAFKEFFTKDLEIK